MTSPQKFFLFLLRVTVGWMFFYAGITKVLNPPCSAEGYLKCTNAFRSERFANYKLYEQMGFIPPWYFFNPWLVCPFQFPFGRSAYGFILYSARFFVSKSALIPSG